jgi:hypothetical protein
MQSLIVCMILICEFEYMNECMEWNAWFNVCDYMK